MITNFCAPATTITIRSIPHGHAVFAFRHAAWEDTTAMGDGHRVGSVFYTPAEETYDAVTPYGGSLDDHQCSIPEKTRSFVSVRQAAIALAANYGMGPENIAAVNY